MKLRMHAALPVLAAFIFAIRNAGANAADQPASTAAEAALGKVLDVACGK